MGYKALQLHIADADASLAEDEGSSTATAELCSVPLELSEYASSGPPASRHVQLQLPDGMGCLEFCITSGVAGTDGDWEAARSEALGTGLGANGAAASASHTGTHAAFVRPGLAAAINGGTARLQIERQRATPWKRAGSRCMSWSARRRTR